MHCPSCGTGVATGHCQSPWCNEGHPNVHDLGLRVSTWRGSSVSKCQPCILRCCQSSCWLAGAGWLWPPHIRTQPRSERSHPALPPFCERRRAYRRRATAVCANYVRCAPASNALSSSLSIRSSPDRIAREARMGLTHVLVLGHILLLHGAVMQTWTTVGHNASRGRASAQRGRDGSFESSSVLVSKMFDDAIRSDIADEDAIAKSTAHFPSPNVTAKNVTARAPPDLERQAGEDRCRVFGRMLALSKQQKLRARLRALGPSNPALMPRPCHILSRYRFQSLTPLDGISPPNPTSKPFRTSSSNQNCTASI